MAETGGFELSNTKLEDKVEFKKLIKAGSKGKVK
jgi:hypothetical protein